jgi:hypothetical protein
MSGIGSNASITYGGRPTPLEWQFFYFTLAKGEPAPLPRLKLYTMLHASYQGIAYGTASFYSYPGVRDHFHQFLLEQDVRLTNILVLGGQIENHSSSLFLGFTEMRLSLHMGPS